MTTVRIVGVGMGPQHVTPEAAAALRASAYVVAAAKRSDDPLLAVRRAVASEFALPVVAVADPPRDRSASGYEGAVLDWHDARAEAWGAEIASREGDPAFLVWGDPSLYDSTIRVVERLGLPYEVVAGIAAPQLLAARHRVVLHEVGAPVHVTTERRLADDVAAGQRNLVVMLTSGVVEGHDDWSIWWGANLGTPSERLVSGRVGDVRPALAEAREAARAEAGFVMDLYLLRAPA
jgi:precorrin-6A synthase